jgi:hypothetical protein
MLCDDEPPLTADIDAIGTGAPDTLALRLRLGDGAGDTDCESPPPPPMAVLLLLLFACAELLLLDVDEMAVLLMRLSITLPRLASLSICLIQYACKQQLTAG